MDKLNIPVVMTSMSRHDHLSSASLSLAKELSLGRKVFYINNPYTYKDNVVSWKGARIFSFSVDYPNLFVVETEKVLPINFLPDNFLYDVVSGINNKIFNKSFKDIVKHHNIRKKEYILFNSFNPFYGIKIPGILEPLLTIYQSRDDIASAPYVKKHGVRLELEWIKKSELVFATGSSLTQKLSELTGVDVKHLPNAASVHVFEQAFSHIVPESNIIGYLGEVETRVDLELLEKTANRFKDNIILMIGPCKNFIIEDFRKKCPNVVFAGFRLFESIPNLIKSFRCAIIPFVKNELTRNIYPLKINEYLAAGLPVVSTNFSSDIAEFAEVAYLSKDHEDFLELVEIAIREDSSERRVTRNKYSKSNNWSSRVSTLLKVIEDYQKLEANV